MVISTIWGHAPGLFRASVVTLLVTVAPVTSADAADESIELAPGLILTPPKQLSLEYVPEGPENDKPILIGYIERQPGYFMVADKVAGRQRNSVLWEKLEMEIRSRADRSSFDISSRGRFSTIEGVRGWYRSYRYVLDGVVINPIYYLIRQGEDSYWVTLTVADDIDRSVAKPIADAVLKRARLTQRGIED